MLSLIHILLTGEIQQKEYAGNDGAFQNEQIGERPEVGSMLIQGLQKLTLLEMCIRDSSRRYARYERP